MSLYICALLFITISLWANGAKGELNSVSTSVAGMVELVQLEAELIDNLRSYADELEAKLKILKSFIPKLQAEINSALNQKENYVSNPINALSLIRRMHEEWHDWKIFVETSVGQKQLAFFNKAETQFPTKKDFNEAISSMLRIQDIYNLTAKDMTKGILNGKQYDASLNALDTYAIGKYLAQLDRRMASEWFMATSEWLKEHILKTPIAEEREKVLLLFAQAISDYKFHSIALSLFDHALLLANNSADPTLLSKRNRIAELARREVKEKPELENEPTDYQIGCRGQYVQQAKLVCTYKSYMHPFLRLAPIKMEALFLDPFIIVFHDVLSAREIEELQQIARPLLKRTEVMHYFGVPTTMNAWTPKGARLKHDLNKLTKRIKRRIMDMVGLQLEGSDDFQVLNYGIGGHFTPHHDYFDPETLNTDENNRIATLIFYLTDVEQGGVTAFPLLKVAVKPKRGTALFWYNMNADGTVDPRSFHGGCPVLVGSKWIMTQWIAISIHRT